MLMGAEESNVVGMCFIVKRRGTDLGTVRNHLLTFLTLTRILWMASMEGTRT